MTVQLTDLKTSLRIDEADDDGLLTGYLTTALFYIKNAVAKRAPDDFWALADVSALTDTATIALASGYFMSRTPLSQVQLFPVDLAVNSIIGQLRGLYDVYVTDLEDENANQS